jgi:hypothetical protein
VKPVYRFGVLLLLVFAVAILLALVLQGSKPSAPWFDDVATGNGYDALVQAAAQMKGRPVDGKGDAAAFVKANERMFELVESALKLPFEIPLSMYSETSSPLADLSAFKTVALALRAKGKEAEERGASGDAGTAYADTIRLGQRVEHGPLIALLVGIAIEKIGLDAVEKLAPQLGPAKRKDLARQLESLEKQRLAFSEVELRERYFARRITGNPLRLIVGRWKVRPALEKATQKQQRLSADFQRVTKELLVPSNSD